jgi:lysozyme
MAALSEQGHKQLIQQLVNDEGYRKFPYKDTMGFLTIGIGRNLSTVGISMPEAYSLLNTDILVAENNVIKLFPVYDDLSDNRKTVLINMCFNMGIGKLGQFVGVIDAVNAKEYEKAAQEMLASLWAKQEPERAQRLAVLMRSG